MGVIKHFSASSYDYDLCVTKKKKRKKKIKGNPDPFNFEIKKYNEIGKYIVLLVNYPDATNYEGDKIMLYENSIEGIRSLDRLDPHFFDNGSKSPIARFKPTDEGWNQAVKLAKLIIGDV